MTIVIETTSNGLRFEEGESGIDLVYKTDTGELEADSLDRQVFLYDLIDCLGWTGSRYDSHRLKVRVEPGDKT